MSKGQHGNKEAKKPKKPVVPGVPAGGAAALPLLAVAPAPRLVKRR